MDEQKVKAVLDARKIWLYNDHDEDSLRRYMQLLKQLTRKERRLFLRLERG